MIRPLGMILGLLMVFLSLACQQEKEPPPRTLTGQGGVLPPLYLASEKSDGKIIGPAAAAGAVATEADTAAKATATQAETAPAPAEDQKAAAATEKQPTEDEQEVKKETSTPTPPQKKPKSEIESQMDAAPAVPGILNRGGG